MEDQEQLIPPEEEPQLPFWARAIAWSTGMLGAVILAFAGFTSLVVNILSIRGLIGAILKLVLAVLILALESPFCCPRIKLGKLKYLHKALMYCFSCIIIFYVLMGKAPLTTVLELLLPFACGVMYGLMSLGLKADKKMMMCAARGRMSQFDPTDLNTI